MRPVFHILIPALAVFSAAAVLEASTDLNRYQVILDKAMFGRPVVRPTPAPQPVRAQPPPPSWAREYRMTMMTYDEYADQVRVGIQNLKDNSGSLLILGEEKNPQGFQLVRADFTRGEAYISLQGDTQVFSFESGPAPQPAPAEPPSVRGRPVRSSSSASPRTIRRVTPAEPTPVPESQFKTQEELEAHLQNYQMEVIRQGLPPLPVPLTPEMDQQLVNEGVLPPQ